MRVTRFHEYGGPEVLTVEEVDVSSFSPDESVVEVRASSVNPSDVANVKGAFGAATPRVPGRDYAGVVVDGSPDWVGKEVWGASPGLGVESDGTHADRVVVKTASLAEKPAELSMEEAATFGIPYLAAWGALVTTGEVKQDETVLIMGAAGAVGEAATQIAHWRGATVIGVDLADGPTGADTYIKSVGQDITPAVRAATDGGHGVDLALDTVGGSMFEPSLRSLRTGGRQIAIAAGGMRRVEFDLVEFFHGLNRLIGVDTNAFSATEIAQIMNGIAAGVRAGELRPRSVQTWPLGNSAEAYKTVAAGPGTSRHIIVP